MTKKQPQAPLVTSVMTTLRKTVQSGESTQVVSPDEIKTKKRDVMNVIDNSLELFKSNLMAGKVNMTTSADLERLVKLMLLVSGEADSRAGRPYGESEQETTTSSQISASISMSKIEEILDINDKDVKSMFDKLYKGYNEANDIDD